MADGGGPTEQDRSEGMPSHSEAPNERGKSPSVTLGLFQVTRCKSGTLGSRYRSNGYVPNQSIPPPPVNYLQSLLTIALTFTA